MKKVLVIPDVHGTRNWVYAKENVNEYDNIIALGDWFDKWNNDWAAVDQIENLREFVEFQYENKEKVISCIGNHDFHYLVNNHGERYSGFQTYKMFDIEEFLKGVKDSFVVAAMVDGVVFSHAGVSKRWAFFHQIKGESSEELLERVNEHGVGDFVRLSFGMNHASPMDTHGDDAYQTPIWIRPFSLWGMKGSNMLFDAQVVGHTEYKDEFSPYVFNDSDLGQWLMCTDSREHRLVEIVIDNGKLVESKRIGG